MIKGAILIMTAFLSATAVYAGPGKYIAEVNGEKLARAEAEKRLWTLYGAGITDEMITETVLVQEARKLGLKIADSEIDGALSDMKKQYGGEAEFINALKWRNLTQREIRAGIGRQLLSVRVIRKIAGIDITGSDAEKFFNENKAAFDTPESVKLRQMFFTDRRQADDMLAALNAGADFEKLARDRSADPAAKDTGGELGFVAVTQLAPGAADAVKNTAAGAHTGVIETPGGFYIILVEEKRAGQPADFSVIKEEVRRTLEQAEIDKAAGGVIGKLRAGARIKKY
ncbi:MAG: peptidyl-prolyl cis-trans isomerase [Elusimicrobiaceae bacterium]|nr:peptidyl-prolyl cis-trans isomerase [Elusimicrobiaceae bacterium]